jgi:membrane-bound lytic murein transglycosylase D
MLKKTLLLLVLGLSIFLGTIQAQDVTYPEMNEESEAILSTLDSLTNLHYFDLKKRNQQVKRLNKYGFRPDDVPTYDDSIYNYRIAFLERDMPFTYNEYVKGFINLYAVRKRNLTEKILGLSQYYFPIFEEALEKAGLPHSLKYLAAVESALNPNAISPAGATGIWQFMYGTARMYNVKINYYYDERRDPYAATQAAVAFFKDLYSIYKDWMLVLAAYNCGPGNVNKAIRKSGGKRDFWSIRPYLPVETRGYVPAFIAVSYVMNFAAEHNLYPTPLITLPTVTDVVAVEGPLYIKDITQHLEVEEETLTLLNPALKLRYIPQSHDFYNLRLPAKLVSVFERKRENIVAGLRKPETNSFVSTENPNNNSVSLVSNEVKDPSNSNNASNSQDEKVANGLYKTKYTVERGDNLRRIAEKYSVTIAEIRDWNNLPNNIIRVGQGLEIFVKQLPENQTALRDSDNQPEEDRSVFSSFRRGKKHKQESKRDKYKTYTVRNGDTLWSIAQKTGHEVSELKRLNGIRKSANLKKGQKLKLPKA